MDLKNFQQIQIAYDLIRSGLRIPLVSSLSGINNKRLLRGFWHEIHGNGPVPGKLPESVVSYTDDFYSAIQVASFVGLYQRIYKWDKVSPEKVARITMDVSTLLKTHEQYAVMWGQPLDINAGYYAIRDVACEIVLFVKCVNCGAEFLYDQSKMYTSKCPYCKTLYLN